MKENRFELLFCLTGVLFKPSIEAIIPIDFEFCYPMFLRNEKALTGNSSGQFAYAIKIQALTTPSSHNFVLVPTSRGPTTFVHKKKSDLKKLLSLFRWTNL